MPNISRSKGNQTMKLRQLIGKLFRQKSGKKGGSEAAHCFLKSFIGEVKASGLQLSSNIFGYPSTWHTIKTNRIKH